MAAAFTFDVFYYEMLWIVMQLHSCFPRFLLATSFGRRNIGCSYRFISSGRSNSNSCIFDGCIRNHGYGLGLSPYRWSWIRVRGNTLTVARYHSTHYPDFFNDSNSSRSNSVTNPIALLGSLEAASEKKEYDRGIQVFENFRRERPDWFKQWPAQKITALIFHMYFKAGTFCKLLSLYDELKNNGFVHGEGIYVTLIKTCIAINNVPKALKFLEELKKIGFRNIRIYQPVITALVNDDQLDLAFQLFEEMQHFEFNQKTRKQFKDQEMLSSLLVNAAAGANKYIDKNDENRKFRVEVVCNVLYYLSTRRITTSAKLKDAIMQAMDAFVEEFSVEIINRDQFKREPQDLNEAQTNVSNVTDVEHFAQLLSLSNKSLQCCVEEENLRDLVTKSRPFSTIIDGANVLLANKGPFKSKLTKITESNLVDLLYCYKQAFYLDRPLIIVSSTIEKRSMFTKSQYFKQITEEYHAEVFVTQHISDDVALLLATLYNDVCLTNKGLNPYTTLISNDSLREHVSVAGQHQLKLNLWLQSKQIKFSWGCNDEIIIHDCSLPMPKASNNWSLHIWDGQVMNITKL